MHKFMNENLRVNIWRDNFTSDYLHVRVNLPSSSIEKLIENKSDLSKLSTLSEPSIVKFIENQSEHLSKLTSYHLKNVLQGDLDVLVNRAESHCYSIKEVSTRRIAC